MNAAGKEGSVPSNFLLPYAAPAGGSAAAAGARARGASAHSVDEEEDDDETDGGGEGGASVADQSLASQEPESLTETAADTGDEEPSESTTAPLGESLMRRT